MSVTVDFVKGHCGWDALTLVRDEQLPSAEALQCALKIVSSPIDGGLEVGLMSPGERAGQIRLRMVSSTARDWIPMCGGMTQVIGKALVETSLGRHFGVDTADGMLHVTLLTPSGEIPIHIDVRDGRARSVRTTMDAYVEYTYQRGVEAMIVGDIPILRVGDYAILRLEDLEAPYPDLDFSSRQRGQALDIVNGVLRAFGERRAISGVNGMMYDARVEGPGQYRVFPRFYSPDLAAARIPWEFQCGTGCIAVAMAIAHTGKLPFSTHSGEIILEWGSHRVTADPYGIRTSRVDIDLGNGRVTSASFSHSVVEILAEGKLTLPGY